jgi:uncharacterized protein YjdB
MVFAGKKTSFSILFALILIFLSMAVTAKAQPESSVIRNQTEIPIITQWPDMPTPFLMKDWKQAGLDYTYFVFDEKKTGPNLPLVKVTPEQGPFSGGYQGDIFGINSYATPSTGGIGEGVTQLSAVAGGSLLGIDMTKLYGRNWVDMCRVYFSKTYNGDGFISNNPGTDCADYWYTLYPTFLYNAVSAVNPANKDLEADVLAAADTWLKALEVINHNWISEGFSVAAMQPFGHDILQPEGVAGVAYLEYQAYLLSNDTKYLDGALSCLDDTGNMEQNPYYEILGSLLPLTAARVNAEQGMAYPIDKFINWVFNADSPFRSDWGDTNARWGDYDAYGLEGSRSDTGGYAFAMNTFITGAQLAPVARYAPEYSDALGKYILTLANNARLFYPDGLPEDMQHNYQLAENMGTTGFLSYEGVRNKSLTTPFATGDDNDAYLCTYGTGPAGIFASMIDKTDVEGILQIDLLKTDFRVKDAYPTYLYYNPHSEEKTVSVDVGNTACNLYDATTKTILYSNAAGKVKINIPARQSIQLVMIPPEAEITYKGKTAYADGIAFDYDYLDGVNIPVTGAVMKQSQLSLVTGSVFQLEYNILPYKASDKGVVWKSSDDSIAKVDANGVITTMVPGQVEISALPKNGEIAAICNINVVQGVDLLANNLMGDVMTYDNGFVTMHGSSVSATTTDSVTMRVNINKYPFLCVKVGNFTEKTSWGLSITNSDGRKHIFYSNDWVDPGDEVETVIDMKKSTHFTLEDDYTFTFTIFGPNRSDEMSYDIFYAKMAHYSLYGAKEGIILDNLSDISSWKPQLSQITGDIDITRFPETTSWNRALGQNANLEITSGVGRIINLVDGWSDITFERKYNIDLYPILKYQLANPTDENVQYALKVGLADSGNYYHEYVIQGDIPVGERNELEINLKEITGYSGNTHIGFSFCIIGKPNDSYDLLYAKAIPDPAAPRGEPVTVARGEGGTMQVDFGPGYGTVTKRFTINLSENPFILGMIKCSNDTNWNISVRGVDGMTDTESEYTILNSQNRENVKIRQEGQRFAADIAGKTGWSGECTFDLLISMSSAQKETMNLYRLIKATTPNDLYSPIDNENAVDNDSKTPIVDEKEKDSTRKLSYILVVLIIAGAVSIGAAVILLRRRKRHP